MRRLEYFRSKRKIRRGIVLGTLLLAIFIVIAILIVNYQYLKLAVRV